MLKMIEDLLQVYTKDINSNEKNLIEENER